MMPSALHRRDLHRRDLLRGVAATALGAAFVPLSSCGSTEDAKRLVFLNWLDYIDPAILDSFAERIDGAVTYETYGSNDELEQRLTSAGVTRRRGRKSSTFDLIVPSDSLLVELKRAGALQELPTISGLDALDPAFRKRGFDPGNRYSVPWATGTTGIGYSKRAFPDAPPTWASFLERPADGKATLLDESRDAMAVALWLLKEDPNTQTAATITAAGRKLAEIRRAGVEFDAEYLDKLRSGTVVLAQAFSSDVAQAMADNDDLAFVIPPEGGLRWVDSLCIPSGAPHASIAAQFIEYYLDPKVSAQNAASVRIDTGNAAAREFLPDDLVSDRLVFPDAATQERLVDTQPLSDDVAERYAKAFAEAKAAK